MSETVELDPLGFPRILHAVLRVNDSPEEVERANAVLKWMTENRTLVGRVLLPGQLRLFGAIQKHYVTHKQPTNRIYAEELARKEEKPDGLIALLEEYDEAVGNGCLQTTSALDMPQLIEDRVADWERVKLLSTLFDARQITAGALAPKKPTDPQLKGARDAISFLSNAMYKDVMVSDTRTAGGDIQSDLNKIMGTYETNKFNRLVKHLDIRTQLSCLDNTIRGFRKPEFVGLLGYASSFKTTLARTFVYNAAIQGYNCLHIPLESSFDEELALYGVMHAHDEKFKDVIADWGGVNRRNFEDGNMTDAQEDFLRNVVIPDFQDNITGNVFIRKPAVSTWGEIRQMIELVDAEQPLDMVLIDYLALMDVGDSKNPVSTVNETIKRVKELCLNFKGGKGMIVLTPVQGNRAGYEAAKANGGLWSESDIFMYSEFEKTLDKIIYIYTDDDLKRECNAKVGTCKSRRTGNCPTTIVRRHDPSGRMMDANGYSAGTTTGSTEAVKAAGTKKDEDCYY